MKLIPQLRFRFSFGCSSAGGAASEFSPKTLKQTVGDTLKLVEVVDSRVFHLGGRLHDINTLRVSPAGDVEEVSGNVAASCHYYGVSRQAYYAWLKRYEADGFEGLKDRSSASHHSPTATNAEVIERILWLRQ